MDASTPHSYREVSLIPDMVSPIAKMSNVGLHTDENSENVGLHTGETHSYVGLHTSSTGIDEHVNVTGRSVEMDKLQLTPKKTENSIERNVKEVIALIEYDEAETFFRKRMKAGSIPDLNKLLITEEEDNPVQCKKLNMSMLVGLDLANWEEDKFFKRNDSDVELFNYETGDRKIINIPTAMGGALLKKNMVIPNYESGDRKIINIPTAREGALLKEEMVEGEIIRLVRENRRNCLSRIFRDLSDRRRLENTQVRGGIVATTPKRKISPDPPTPAAKGRRLSEMEASPKLRPMTNNTWLKGGHRARAESLSTPAIKNRTKRTPGRRCRSNSAKYTPDQQQPLIHQLFKKVDGIVPYSKE